MVVTGSFAIRHKGMDFVTSRTDPRAVERPISAVQVGSPEVPSNAGSWRHRDPEAGRPKFVWTMCYNGDMVRPGSWTSPAGESPVRVIAGEPGSRPRFVVERRRVERGVKSLFGGSKRAGRRATRSEFCSPVTFTMGEPSRSCHGEGDIRPAGVPDMPLVGSLRGKGSGTYARDGLEQERPVWPVLSAKTVGISQW
jgi:hypothetical protein